LTYWVMAAMLVATGRATHYAPGVMAQVIANRVEMGDIDLNVPHEDYVAVMDPAYLGDQVWLELPDGRVSGPHLVVDCAARHDRADLEADGFAVDLSYSLAQALGTVGAPLEDVKVWRHDPQMAQRID